MITSHKLTMSAYEHSTYADFVTNYITPINTNYGITIDNLGVCSDDAKNIYGFSFGTVGKPVIYIQSSIHGDEWETAFYTITFVEMIINPSLAPYPLQKIFKYLKYNYSFYYIPVVNPWGFENKTRENFNDVDCNRNFETWTEPETIIVRDKVQELKPLAYIDNHAMNRTSRHSVGGGVFKTRTLIDNIIKNMNFLLDVYVDPYPIDPYEAATDRGRGWISTQLSNYGTNTIAILLECGWSQEHTAYLQEKGDFGLNANLSALLHLDNFWKNRTLTI